MRVLQHCAAWVALVLTAAGAGVCADLYRVAGTVVNASNGSAMGGVRVILAPHERPSEETIVMTGGDGRFSFDAPQGKYLLSAALRGLREVYGARTLGSGFGTAVLTGPELDTSQLVFLWRQTASIGGKVQDEWGDPVEAALVQVIRSSVINGRRQARTIAWRHTDDRGEYYAGPLPEGGYFIAVTGRPWYERQRHGFGLLEHHEAPSYATKYFPNAAAPPGATLVEVKPGAEARADFTLSETRAATVHVRCAEREGQAQHAGGQFRVMLAIDGIPGAESYQSNEWAYGCNTFIRGVPPGHYTLRLVGNGASGMYAEQKIDVGASDVDVELRPQPWSKIGGRVEFLPPERPPADAVLVGLIDQDTHHTLWARVAADGAFTVPGGLVGRARIVVNAKSGLFAERIDVEGAALDDDMLDVPGGAMVKLRIVASAGKGRVHGYAIGTEGAQEGALVLLVPAQAAAPLRHYHAFQSDSDGSFDFDAVRPGDYFLLAVDDLNLEFGRRAALEGLLAAAKPVHVVAGGDVQERIPVVAVPAGQR